MEVMKNKQEQQQKMQQTRNVIHTELCSKGEREKNEKEHTHDYVVHLEKGYIHGREKQKAFIMVAVYKWKLIHFKIQGILALYRQRTKQKKKIQNNLPYGFRSQPNNSPP